MSVEFQSTLPVGGATSNLSSNQELKDISIHAPRGGSDLFCFLKLLTLTNFNPRSPWGERHFLLEVSIMSVEFQSTLPVGGATVQ